MQWIMDCTFIQALALHDDPGCEIICTIFGTVIIW